MNNITKPKLPSLLMHVWIHSHAETGEPLEVCVLDVQGRMNMTWFSGVFDDKNSSELADDFYSVFQFVEDSAWFSIQPTIENNDEGMLDCWLEVISLSTTPSTNLQE